MNSTTMRIIVNKQLLVKTFLSSRLKTVLPIQTLSLLKRASETEFVLALKTIAWERMKCTVQLIWGLKIRQIYLWALTTHSWSTRKIVVICRGANQWTALEALVKSLRSRQATRIAANSAPSSDNRMIELLHWLFQSSFLLMAEQRCIKKYLILHKIFLWITNLNI